MSATVLIVDDHPTFRRFVRQLLEEADFSVVGEAADGAGALVAASELHPDVVLLDVLLPDRSGLDIACQLAASPGGGPTVVLTSSRDASDFGTALESVPAAGFVPKALLSGATLAELITR